MLQRHQFGMVNKAQILAIATTAMARPYKSLGTQNGAQRTCRLLKAPEQAHVAEVAQRQLEHPTSRRLMRRADIFTKSKSLHNSGLGLRAQGWNDRSKLLTAQRDGAHLALTLPTNTRIGGVTGRSAINASDVRYIRAHLFVWVSLSFKLGFDMARQLAYPRAVIRKSTFWEENLFASTALQRYSSSNRWRRPERSLVLVLGMVLGQLFAADLARAEFERVHVHGTRIQPEDPCFRNPNLCSGDFGDLGLGNGYRDGPGPSSGDGQPKKVPPKKPEEKKAEREACVAKSELDRRAATLIYERSMEVCAAGTSSWVGYLREQWKKEGFELFGNFRPQDCVSTNTRAFEDRWAIIERRYDACIAAAS
ncbi:hypothetical protein HNP55_004731 [Paucibacter oligotrophus]|uniref:Uncharacterized protein n=1 Tax=Roseateles oligotrophus TaxID=1769250 RepID=A0A840LLJ2_9BURK|nr:hypothetical protein [Roseateles oligotrophus]MBB4846177.1 hypothetical protein [Roseateles oligotrophus]